MPEPLKLAELKLRMQAYGIRPKKKFGQNILADFNLLKAIVADAEIGPDDLVLEIGTGAGSLTGYLCDAAGQVISVEVDTGMYEMSRDLLTGVPNLTQIHADALSSQGRGLNDDVIAAVNERLPASGQLKLVANLPYSVATAVLIAALESGLPFERMLVMVQYDVAEKLAAAPGKGDWGLPSLLRWCFAEAAVKRRVPAKVFWPKPKVESALLELRPKATRPDMTAYHQLRRLAHVMYQHRRKAGANALSQALGVDNAQAAVWIREAGGDPQHRPEQMPPEVFFTLAAHAEVEPLVRKSMSLHEDQLLEKAARRARRDEWKRRVYGEEE